MRTVCSCAVLLFAAAIAAAAPPEVKLPAEAKGQPGAFVVVRAETAGKAVRWYAPDPGLSLFPSDLLADRKVAIVVGSKPGRYRLVAWTAAGDEPSEPAICVIQIGDPPPPGPTPPVPPDDPLAVDLARLYAADTTPDKAKHLGSLVELYRQAGTLTADTGLKTLGDLLAILRSASASLLPPEALLPLRKRIAEHCSADLGTDAGAELTTAMRQKAATCFGHTRTALEGISR